MPDIWQPLTTYSETTLPIYIKIWPELAEYSDRAYVIYAALNADCPFYARAIEDIINEVVDAITNKNKNIIIFNNADEDYNIATVSRLHVIMKYISRLNLSCHFIYATGGYYYEDSYDHEVKKLDYKEKLAIVPIHYCHLTWYHKCSILRNFHDLLPEYTPIIRDKKFLCFNRSPREHRIELLDNLLKEDLVKHSYYSLYISKDEASEVDTKYPDKPFLNIKKHADMFPLVLNLEGLTGSRQGVDLIEDDFKYFINSYFSVVTETMYYYQYPYAITVFPTEKVYKCLSLKHPFIIVGRPKSLLNLKELGYKTFHPYINESYDLIYNNGQRMNTIVSEIKRLCSFTDDQWLEWQHNIKSILDHNFNVFMNAKRFSLFNLNDIIKGNSNV